MQNSQFLIVPTCLLAAYSAKEAIFLAYIANLYKMVKTAQKLENGAFYCCIDAAAQTTQVKSTTQRELLKKLAKDGMLEVDYHGEKGKRYIKILPKMQAEFPLLFGFCGAKNEHQNESRCAKNAAADARKSLPNNKEYKNKEKLVSLKKDTRIGARNFFVSDESQKTAASANALELSQKSCAKKGFSIAEGIWAAYQDFCQYNQLAFGKLTSSALNCCQSIADQLAVVLQDRQDKDILRAWYYLLGGVLTGRQLEGQAAAKAQIRKNCAYYCKETKSIALFDAQLTNLVQLVQQVATFMQNAKKPASGKSSRMQADQQIEKLMQSAAAKAQAKSIDKKPVAQSDAPKAANTAAEVKTAHSSPKTSVQQPALTRKELMQQERAKHQQAIAQMQQQQSSAPAFEFPAVPVFCQQLQALATLGANQAQQRAQQLLNAAKDAQAIAADFVMGCINWFASANPAAQVLKKAVLSLDMQPAQALAQLAQQSLSSPQK